MKVRRTSSCLLITSLLGLLLPPAASAFTPGVTKLFAKGTIPQVNSYFGYSNALSDTYLLVGEPNNDDKAFNAGAAHLFDAKTGRHLRKLTANDATSLDGLGSCVAVSGHLLVVGAPRDNAFQGSAYVFDARNGRQLHKLTALDGTTSDIFGTAVAINGGLILVGARGDNSERGAAYLFDASTGEQLRKISAGDGAAGDRFGSSVALCGNFALVGAHGDDFNKGAAYLFDASNGTQLGKFTASDGAANDFFGISVAMSGHYALVGAIGDGGSKGAAYLHSLRSGGQVKKLTASDGSPGDHFGNSVALEGSLALIGAPDANDSRGAAYAFNYRSGDEITKLTAADGNDGDFFGFNVALSANNALIGAHLDSDLATSPVAAGAAFQYRGLAGQLQLTTVARQKDFAPNVGGASFTRIGDAVINNNFTTAFPATLSNRKRGVWQHLYFSTLQLASLPGSSLLHPLSMTPLNVTVSSLHPPLLADDHLLLRANVRGSGAPGAGSQSLLRTDATGASFGILSPGGAEPFPGQNFHAFPEAVQKYSSGQVAASYRLRRAGGVTAANDTGIFLSDNNGTPIASGSAGTRNREGTPSPAASGTYGQFMGRAGLGHGFAAIFPAYYLPAGSPPARQGLFSQNLGGSQGVVSRQGAQPPGIIAPGAALRSFLAESVLNFATFRATFTGTGINTSNNEALFSEAGFSYLRKGRAPDPSQPLQVVNRILGFWQLNTDTNIMALVTLRGKGVTAANDTALCLIESNGFNIQILIREGDSVCGSDAPKIRVIQRVDVDAENSNYIVLATLTGSSKSNQALFTGNAGIGNNSSLKAKREPGLILRKGTLYQAALGQTTAIRSMSLPVTTDKGGAGAKGLSQVINNSGAITLTIDFDNRAREIVSGLP